MMDVNETYCGHHFTIYVSQTIMLYTLNLYSDVCQLYVNKTGKIEIIRQNQWECPMDELSYFEKTYSTW